GPAQATVVTVSAEPDKQTGILTWRFNSIDETTGQSTEDPSAGFLPPNESPPAGEGSVVFSVLPKPGLPPGTSICNQTSIVFDQNDPLATPTWCNTIDAVAPTSQVDAAADSRCTHTLDVRWSG